jgi:hypothetical protein
MAFFVTASISKDYEYGQAARTPIAHIVCQYSCVISGQNRSCAVESGRAFEAMMEAIQTDRAGFGFNSKGRKLVYRQGAKHAKDLSGEDGGPAFAR